MMSYRILQPYSSNMWKKPQVNRFSYNEKMNWTWKQTQQNQSDYFARLNATVSNSFGNVLEIGCGIGNITKWLDASNLVNQVIAFDSVESCNDTVDKHKFKKVSVKDNLNKIPKSFKADCLMLTEVIEHLTTEDEKSLLKKLSSILTKGCKFIISVPLGHFPDPTHVREFNKTDFINHIESNYGNITKLDYSSGYSQIAYGVVQ